jgi:hypothetical protein
MYVVLEFMAVLLYQQLVGLEPQLLLPLLLPAQPMVLTRPETHGPTGADASLHTG